MTTFRRELRTLLTSPQAWAIATAYVIISGLFFVTLLFSRPFPDLERYYTNIETTLLAVAPIIAMRSFAEERRTGVLDITLSWPVSRWSLVLGKFLANTVFMWVMVSVCWLYVSLLASLGPIEVGKAAAGWIGLLLLSGMFSAIALAVSARSGSPTGAAFVGFGVLLGLWILDFVPGWLGGRFDGLVKFLAPTNHIENSGRGILDAGDALYFLMATAFGLTVAALAVRERGRRGMRLWLRPRQAGALVGLAVVLGSGVASAEAQGQIDLTPERRFTLTPQSRAVLRETRQPIQIIAFTQPGSAQMFEIRSLVRRYQLVEPSVKLQLIDPDAQPGQAKQLGGGNYGQMRVEVGGRHEMVNDIGEIDLTSAIQRLSRGHRPLACFTVGHGERSPEDQRDGGYYLFANDLQQLGYDVKPLALAAAGGAGRLASCRVVIVAGPRALFLPEELDMLQAFARREGRLIVLAEQNQEVVEQLNGLVEPWGLRIKPGIVTDRSSLINDPAAVLAFKYPSRSPVTNELLRLGIPLLLVGAQPVESTVLGVGETEEAPWLVPLVESSSRSSLGDETDGPFVLGAITDWGRVRNQDKLPELSLTRIAVVGNADFASNKYFEDFGNGTFATRLVSWVAIENDIIAATREPGGTTKLMLTEDDRGRLIRLAIATPGGITGLLFLTMLIRLRRL